MTMQKTKLEYTVNNLIWRAIYGIETIVLPFVIRTLIIYRWGMEYIGINGLFTALLQVLNIAELGFGSAILFSMYKPMAEHDVGKVNALLMMYKKIYRFIGSGILFVGLALLPFVRHFIHGTPPDDVNIYIIYLIQLFNTVMGYLFLSYWNVILQAQQRIDIDFIINSVFVGIMYILQITVICVSKNYYLYFGLLPATNIVISYIRARYINKAYPEYYCAGSLDKAFRVDMIKRVSAMALSKIRTAIRMSIDSIVISMNLGLVVLTQYQNYFQIILVPLTIISIIRGSVLPSMGVDVATESEENTYNVFVVYSFISNWITTWCTIVYVLGVQTFMEIWVGKENVLSIYMAYLFGLYFYLFGLSENALLIRETAGIWWKGKMGAVVETGLNILLNIVLVKIMGVEGIILATVLSMLLINIPVEFWSIFQGYFQRSPREYIFKQIRYFINLVIIIWISGKVVVYIPEAGMFGWFLKLSALIIIPNIAYMVLNLRCKEFMKTKELCKDIIEKYYKRMKQ